MSERTYTEAEMQLERAAWKAQTAAMLEKGPCGKHPVMFWERIPANRQLVDSEGLVEKYHCTICAELSALKARIAKLEGSR